MAKLTEKTANGTSFHNSTINATVEDLVRVLGQAQYQSNDGDDKVNFEWTCETTNGDVFTVYDWKEYRSIETDEDIEWHIGGDSSAITSEAAREVELLLTQ